MELEKQVVSLELAKELKENGYPQKEGLWWWNQNTFYNDEEKPLEYYLSRENKGFNSIVAPTVAELGERLPNSVARGINFRLEFGKNPDNYSICYVPCGLGGYSSLKYLTDISEANARAKMWLYLKKENLL